MKICIYVFNFSQVLTELFNFCSEHDPCQVFHGELGKIEVDKIDNFPVVFMKCERFQGLSLHDGSNARVRMYRALCMIL